MSDPSQAATGPGLNGPAEAVLGSDAFVGRPPHTEYAMRHVCRSSRSLQRLFGRLDLMSKGPPGRLLGPHQQ